MQPKKAVNSGNPHAGNPEPRKHRTKNSLVLSTEQKLHKAARLKEYHRKWYLRNRERKLKQNAAWRAANPARASALVRAWAKKHPDRIRDAQYRFYWRHATRLRRKAVERKLRNIDPVLLSQKLKYHDHRCVYCGSTAYLSWDHVKPKAAGGRDILSNLVPACKSCNSKKRDRWTTPSDALRCRDYRVRLCNNKLDFDAASR